MRIERGNTLWPVYTELFDIKYEYRYRIFLSLKQNAP